ncbi:antitoxin [Gordonia terrae]|uniref:antitoxin n=1 Tax=Gordonia terrae TaxID=2055 RepID=UPI003F6B421B
MNLKGLVNKAKATLKQNPALIEKGGDAIDKVTKNKYSGQVNKAQDAVRKAVGQNPGHNPGQQNPNNPQR